MSTRLVTAWEIDFIILFKLDCRCVSHFGVCGNNRGELINRLACVSASLVVLSSFTTLKSKVAAVLTAFSLEALSINQPPKYSASKGSCCRHSCNLYNNNNNNIIIIITTENSRYNEVLGTCKFLRYKLIKTNTFSALGENFHFVISGYFVISDFVITGVDCGIIIFIFINININIIIIIINIFIVIIFSVDDVLATRRYGN